MSKDSTNKKLYQNIDTAIYFAAGLAIAGGSTAFTLMSLGASSPITFCTTTLGLGLIGGFGATLIPIKLTNYEDKCDYKDDDKKPMSSPTKAIYEMFGLDSRGKEKTT